MSFFIGNYFINLHPTQVTYLQSSAENKEADHKYVEQIIADLFEAGESVIIEPASVQLKE